MKKILLLVLMQLSIASSVAQQLHGPLIKNEEGYVLVHDAEELERAITFNLDRIQLAADIEIPNLRQICGTFRGTITVKHKVYDEELGKEVDVMYSIDGGRENGGKKTWLFDKVEGATFEYICFKNFRVEEDVWNGGKLGLIAKEAVNCVFSNLAFDNISVFEDDDEAGVIAGVASGCQFENIVSTFCDVTIDGASVGGLVGRSVNSTYTMCIISLTSGAFADGKLLGAAYAGGLVGESENDTFVKCINAGIVAGNADSLGGIAAKSINSRFTSCNNYNAVFFCEETGDQKNRTYFKEALSQIRDKVKEISTEDIKKLGMPFDIPFIIGAAQIMIGGGMHIIETISQEALQYSALHCALFTFVGLIVMDWYFEGTDYDFVGGICGFAEKCNFELCSNFAPLYCDDADCGGIAGLAKGGAINNCLNTGGAYNDGAKSLGGIVGGVLSKPKITNCLSTYGLPIMASHRIKGVVGSFSTPADVADGSGNNYRLNSDVTNLFKCFETQVDSAQIADGSVAILLNNGVENVNLGIKPWRQNLTSEYIDDFPVLDMTHDEVVKSPEDVADEAPYALRPCDECAASINDAAHDAETSGEAYDIMGHKVGCNHHGIIIVNGKKVINNH